MLELLLYDTAAALIVPSHRLVTAVLPCYIRVTQKGTLAYHCTPSTGTSTNHQYAFLLIWRCNVLHANALHRTKAMGISIGVDLNHNRVAP
jgi:hypothetical protein